VARICTPPLNHPASEAPASEEITRSPFRDSELGWYLSVKIVRRVGASPRERGSASGQTCPDIFELSDGNFAVIGREATKELDPELPPDAARADYERIVVITRETLVRAKSDIPDA
jgi:hypothetical protein